MMDKDYNHPSVIMYSLGNELASPTILDKKGFEILKELCGYNKTNDYRPSTMGINLTNLERKELNAHKAKYKMMEVYTNSDEIVDIDNNLIVEFGRGLAEISIAKDSEDVSVETYKILDLAGDNYAYNRYELDSKIHPERIIVGPETMCQDIYNNYEIMNKYPAVVGDFIWTGIDYFGEDGIGGYFD
jgi:beta-galactosidase/beta-glucuronidase